MCGLNMDITLDGYKLVRLGEVRITLIVPRGGLEEASLWCVDLT